MILQEIQYCFCFTKENILSQSSTTTKKLMMFLWNLHACNIFDYDYPKYMGKQIINDTAQWNDILNHWILKWNKKIFSDKANHQKCVNK